MGVNVMLFGKIRYLNLKRKLLFFNYLVSIITDWWMITTQIKGSGNYGILYFKMNIAVKRNTYKTNWNHIHAQYWKEMDFIIVDCRSYASENWLHDVMICMVTRSTFLASCEDYSTYRWVSFTNGQWCGNFYITLFFVGLKKSYGE